MSRSVGRTDWKTVVKVACAALYLLFGACALCLGVLVALPLIPIVVVALTFGIWNIVCGGPDPLFSGVPALGAIGIWVLLTLLDLGAILYFAHYTGYFWKVLRRTASRRSRRRKSFHSRPR